MPGSIAACAVSSLFLQMKFAAIMLLSDEAETQTYQASEGLNAQGFSQLPQSCDSLRSFPANQALPTQSPMLQ